MINSWAAVSRITGLFIAFISIIGLHLCRADSISAVKPESPAESEYRKGLTDLVKGDLNTAEAAFKQSLQLEPKQIISILGLADIAVRRGQGKVAEEYLRRALTLAPNSSEVQRAWGRYLYSQKKFVPAEAAFKKAIVSNPKSADPRVDLADLYLKGLRNFPEAINTYKSALALAPTLASAHYGLGVALAGVKQYSQALDSLSATLKAQPQFTQAYLARGEIFEVTGENDKALAEYAAALKANPKFAQAHVKIGMIQERKKQTAEAEKSYLAAIELDSNQPIAYNNLAWAAAERRTRLDDALVWAKKAVELAPAAPEFQDTLGWVYRARGELDKATSALQKAASAKPELAEVIYHLGVVYAENGKTNDAEATLRKALALKKDFAGADDARKRLNSLRGAQSVSPKP